MGHRHRKYTLDLFNAGIFCICAEPKAKIDPSSEQFENSSVSTGTDNNQQYFFATWKPRNYMKDGPTVVDCIRVRVETTERPRTVGLYQDARNNK
jgi:hypothetical protein